MNTVETPRTLPDLLRPGLDLVFVGINPGETSARRGHYYANPGNASGISSPNLHWSRTA